MIENSQHATRSRLHDEVIVNPLYHQSGMFVNEHFVGMDILKQKKIVCSTTHLR